MPKPTLFAFVLLIDSSAASATRSQSCTVTCPDGSSCSITEPAPVVDEVPQGRATSVKSIISTSSDSFGGTSTYESDVLARARLILKLLGAVRPASKEVSGMISRLQMAIAEVATVNLVATLVEVERWNRIHADAQIARALEKVTCSCSPGAPPGRQAHCGY